MWAWYVTWGIVVLAAVAAGRMRTVVIAVSAFWAFAGVTSIHGIFQRLIHTFALTDLLLVAALLAIAIAPLAQFGTSRPRLPRIRPDAGPSVPSAVAAA